MEKGGIKGSESCLCSDLEVSRPTETLLSSRGASSVVLGVNGSRRGKSIWRRIMGEVL